MIPRDSGMRGHVSRSAYSLRVPERNFRIVGAFAMRSDWERVQCAIERKARDALPGTNSKRDNVYMC